VQTHALYQKAYLTSELEELFEKLRSRRVGGTVLANERVRAAVAGKAVPSEDSSTTTNRRSLQDGDADCPICFDDLTSVPNHQLTYCRAACGANFHADCIRRWLEASRHNSCPNCRSPWQPHGTTTAAAAAATSLEGYANYGALQGQSAERDTSTYYSPSNNYYKRRGWR